MTRSTISTRDQVEEATVLCARAFVDYPLMTALFPGSGRDRLPVARALYGSIVRDCFRHGIVHAEVARGELVGVACWLPPGRWPLGPFRQAAMARTVLEVLRRFPSRVPPGVEFMRSTEAAHPKDPPHWYLATVAVDPAHQRRGIGGRLLHPVLELVDALEEPVFLETASGSNAAWYGRHDFETIHAEPAFDGGPVQWAMWRSPTTGTSSDA